MLDHPYTSLTGGRWLRGNLHTHTTRSDGARPAAAVLADYAGRGYGFLMLSDHDTYTSAADYAQWDAHGLILIPGNEITADGPHLLHVGADRLIAPAADRQAVIDAVRAAAGFIIVNHPNWEADFDHCPLARMREWQGYVGLEICNGTIGRLDGSPYALDKWDMLLAAGRRLWGFAHDDSHLPADDVKLAWNVAYVTDPTPAGVVAALRTGRFYGSTGVAITNIQVADRRIRIETEGAQRIVAVRETGRRFAVVDACAIEVEYPDRARYVRFECYGPADQRAWTQPFWPPRAE